MAYQIEGIEHGAGRKFCIGSQYFSQIDLEDVRQSTKRYVPRVRLVKGDPNYVSPVGLDKDNTEPEHGELSDQSSLDL